MTLYQVVKGLERIALTHPNVRTANDGNVYDLLNVADPSEYCYVVVSQTTHRQTEQFDHYGFNIFFIDRLVDDLESNRLQIQSIGKQILGNVIATFCETYDIDFPTITYHPFTQKFLDLCGGQYASFELEIPRDIICAEYFDENE